MVIAMAFRSGSTSVLMKRLSRINGNCPLRRSLNADTLCIELTPRQDQGRPRRCFQRCRQFGCALRPGLSPTQVAAPLAYRGAGHLHPSLPYFLHHVPQVMPSLSVLVALRQVLASALLAVRPSNVTETTVRIQLSIMIGSFVCERPRRRTYLACLSISPCNNSSILLILWSIIQPKHNPPPHNGNHEYSDCQGIQEQIQSGFMVRINAISSKRRPLINPSPARS